MTLQKQDRIKILLLDDDEEDFFIIQDILSRAALGRYKVEWSSKVDTAFNLLEQNDFQICLVDYRLGAKNGLDFIAEVIRRGIKTPCILLTGYGDQTIDIKAMEVGAADYLVKMNLNTDLLERSIRYTINRAVQVNILKAEEESMSSLLEAAFEAIIVYDLSSKVIMVNRSATELFDVGFETMIGNYIENYVPKDYLFSDTQSETLRYKDEQRKLNLEFSSRPFIYRQHQAFLVTIRDVTSRSQLEAQVLQQDRLATVGMLASGLAHEIGTPLGVIRGRAELLQAKAQDPDYVIKNTDIILSQIDRISRLVKSLLTLARGNPEAEPVSINLSEVTYEVMELMQHELRKNNIEITVDIPKVAMGKGVASSYHQVMLNLLVNATQAIQEKQKANTDFKGQISISIVTQDNFWLVRVKDNGPGISAENIKKIFTPFFTTKEIGKGTGLGLVTSFKILESWGGGIQVESNFGEGAIFSLTIPKIS